MATTALQLSLMGNYSVQINGNPHSHLPANDSYRLLSLLLLRRGMPIELTTLCRILWPEHQSKAREHACLRRCLVDSRKALGPVAARLQVPNAYHVLFEPHPTDCLHVFSCKRETSSARGGSGREIAATLYCGPLLEIEHDSSVTLENIRLS